MPVTVIGYYAHHRGAGHVNRAIAIAQRLNDTVTILSSASKPPSWHGAWIGLPLDENSQEGATAADITADGALHWVPMASGGLRSRMAMISEWLDDARPSVVIVDVSVEVAVMVRLHGIQVVTIAVPGVRIDAPHTLGYRASSAVIAAWPDGIRALVVEPGIEARVRYVGAISRIPIVDVHLRDPRQVAVLSGFGGIGESRLDRMVLEARLATPHLRWVVISGMGSAAVASVLRTSGVVIAHCGENAVAEIAASRVPAILIPEDRPYDEQFTMGKAIAESGMPATVLSTDARINWAVLLEQSAAMPSHRWGEWCDGDAAGRAAEIVHSVAARTSEQVSA